MRRIDFPEDSFAVDNATAPFSGEEESDIGSYPELQVSELAMSEFVGDGLDI